MLAIASEAFAPRWRSRGASAAAASLMALLIATAAAPGAHAAPTAVHVAVTGTNGTGRSDTAGRPCADGGQGASWHYDHRADLAPGVFSALAGEARLHLDVHRDVPAGGPTAGLKAFLLGGESHATLANWRGTLTMRLASGSCAAPTLAVNGSTASGTGTWTVAAGTGSYRNSTGNGSFTVSSALAPGADNPWSLDLTGSVAVPQPALKVEFVSSYWGFFGADYLARRVTTVHRVTNVGPGDAFGARVTSASSPTRGVTALGPVPQKLGDLLPGDSELVRTKWTIGVDAPCGAVILGCPFDTTFGLEVADALDVGSTSSSTTRSQAPAFPPPL